MVFTETDHQVRNIFPASVEVKVDFIHDSEQ